MEAHLTLSGKFDSPTACWASSRIQSLSCIQQYCIDLFNDTSGSFDAVVNLALPQPGGQRVGYNYFPVLNSIALTSLIILQAHLTL
ncbi:hypothetical protein J6590_068936 [Homalodisca vitripennis]|nr:hypothetical protein J6590_068936 [Homalodisca vitripennis]